MATELFWKMAFLQSIDGQFPSRQFEQRNGDYMHSFKPLLLAGILILSACDPTEIAATTLSDERLASEAGGVLGINPANLTVTERRSTYGSATYFTVRASNGRKYNCVITGGGPLAFGLTNPPDCARDGQPIQRRPLF